MAARRAEPLAEAQAPATSDRAHPLLEREPELAQLTALLCGARLGAGSAALIEGPAGIGKTRLLQEARCTAEGQGLRVLTAHGGELEQDFGFGIVRQLLEPVLARAGDDERNELFSGAARLARTVFEYEADERPVAADTTHSILHGLYWLLANVAERSSLLVMVDDVHWADAPSQRFLLHLCRRLDSLPVALVLTLRSGEPGAQPELLDALTVEARPRVIRPRTLSEDGVGRMIEDRLGAVSSHESRRAVLDLTGGNPFLVEETLQELATGDPALRDLDPSAVRQIGSRRIASAILFRVGRLSHAAPALANAVAVLGEGATLGRVATLAGLHRSRAAEVADLLAAARVLEPGLPMRFVHPIVRTAIYEEIPRSQRARAHADAAKLLAAEGMEPGVISVHLLAAEPAADDNVVETLRRAATASLSQGAPETAARYLRRAFAEPPSPEVKAEVLRELGSAAARAGSPDGLAMMREAFALSHGDGSRAAAGLELGVALTWPGTGLDEAVGVFERALDGPADGQLGTSIEAMLLLAGVTRPATRARISERLVEARPRAERLPAESARKLLGPLALDVLLTDGDAAVAARMAERALAEEGLLRLEITTDMPLASPAILALILVGRLREAERTLDDAVAQAQARGSPVIVARAYAFRSYVRYRLGQLTDAETDARSCLDLDPEVSRGIPRPLATAALVSVLLERGDPPAARAALRQLQPPGYDPDVTPIQPLRESRAKLLQAEGEQHAALAELEACARWENDWGGHGMTPVAWRSAAALIQLRLGACSEARRLAEQELELAQRVGAPAAIGVAARVSGIVAGCDRGIDLLERSEAELAGSQASLEYAYTLTELGAMLRRQGKRAAAIDKLRKGLETAHACGALKLVRSARQELKLAGVRAARMSLSGRDALTPAERRVADLARDGMRNKEIAQVLFVTLRTVEMHLSSAYRKLGISSRDDLPSALANS